MSKFSGLRTVRQPENQTPTNLNIETSGDLDIQKSESLDTEQFKMGRPRLKAAKHRNPDFRQVTAYLRRDTYADVRARLFTEEREFSDLVQNLLVEWLKR